MFGKSSTATLPAQTSNLPAQIAALISPRYCLATVLHFNKTLTNIIWKYNKIICIFVVHIKSQSRL
jgi:hypothetical protein